MNTNMEQFSAKNPNPVLSVAKNGTVLYSNEAAEPLLHKWSVKVGEKLPSSIKEFVQRVISLNNPEKIEVKAEKRVYLVSFHPSTEEECVNIYGFDISGQKELEEKLRESEKKYRNIIEIANEGILILNAEAMITYINKKMAEMLECTQDEIIGKSIRDFTDEKGKTIFEQNMKKRRQGIDESHEFKFILKDGSPLWTLVNSKALFDKSGKFIGSLSMLTDITERKKAEKALRESEVNRKVAEAIETERQRLYNVLETLPAMISLLTPDYHVAFSNRSFREKFGESGGRHCYEYCYERTKPCEFCESYKVFETGQPHNWEVTTSHGSVIDIYSLPFNDVGGLPLVLDMKVDITERKKTDERIQILANVVESSNDAIITQSLDGIVTSWNKGAEHIYGYLAEEVLGKNISILEPSTHKGGIKQLIDKTKDSEIVQRFETLRQRKDGKIIHVSLTLSPIFDQSGRFVAVSCIARDITERKETEEKLRESEEKYRNIVETANEGIFLMDREFKITYGNNRAAELMGYSCEEAIGRSIMDFIPDESKSLATHHLENRRRGINGSYELKLARKDGSLFWTLVNGKPLFDKNGNFVGSLCMYTDITERKKAEEALINIEIARKQEIHHRIKNNLQVISSLLDLQAEKFKDREDIKDLEVLEAFRESQDRVISMALIHEELHKEGDTGTLNFSQYIEKLADNLFLTYRLDNEGIRFNKNIDEEIFFDMDTSVPLGIIINELVSNSLKYAFPSGDKGEIRIELRRDENGERISSSEGSISEDCKSNFILSVSDNGVGIPQDLDIENLDSLGLQLVISLAEQLDGELELKRDNGTEFIIRFTVEENNCQASAPATQQSV